MRGFVAALGCLLGSAVIAADYGTMLAETLKLLPTSPTPDPTTSPPDKPRVDPGVQIRSAGNTTMRGDVIVLENGAVVEFRERTLTAEHMEINSRNRTAILTGQANVVGQGDELTGEEIRLDMRYRTYSLRNGVSRVSPAWLEGRVVTPVFINAADLRGQPERIEGRAVRVTTCDHEDHPHYDFGAGGLDVLPGDRIILRGARIRALGRTILRLPTITIPLIEDGDRYLPEVGQSPDEGYYIKARFSTEVGTEIVDFLTDYMTKLGLGLGSEYRNSHGLTRLYGILGRDPTLTASQTYSGNVGPGFLNFDGLYQKSAYQFAPETTVTSARLSYALNGSQGNTLLTAFRSGTATGGFTSAAESVSISDRRTWGGGPRIGTRPSVPRREEVLSQDPKPTARSSRPQGPLTTDVNFTWNRSSSQFTGGGTEAERLDVKFGARQSFSMADAEFAYERSIPISQTTNFFGNRDRTPFLSLSSDAVRLGWLTNNAPFRMDFDTSIGELIDPTRRRPITRMTFETGLQGSPRFDRSNPWTFNYSGRFLQGMYSDDTAQYILRYDARVGYRVGSNSSLGINYRTNKPVGFTPLAIDRQGRFDSAGFDAQFNFRNGLQFQAQTGYDFLAGMRGIVPWQQVSFQLNYLPNDRLRIRTNANYDTFSQVWGFVRMDADFWISDTRVVTAVRYDARRSVWGGISAVVEGFRLGKLGGNFGVDYNGYTRRIEAQQYELTYDLHCTEAVLTFSETRAGFRAGRQIAFFIRIKGLPGGSPFGTGNRGQNLFGVGGAGF
ncbi:MAG: LPS-assembly protein LptD [Fimbriimonadaceae bacterium]|nr:LPS-assembly protein LptD [Fimbriimonadaceae bacterium]